jgi:hypothetical protein
MGVRLLIRIQMVPPGNYSTCIKSRFHRPSAACIPRLAAVCYSQGRFYLLHGHNCWLLIDTLPRCFYIMLFVDRLFPQVELEGLQKRWNEPGPDWRGFDGV